MLRVIAVAVGIMVLGGSTTDEGVAGTAAIGTVVVTGAVVLPPAGPLLLAPVPPAEVVVAPFPPAPVIPGGPLLTPPVPYSPGYCYADTRSGALMYSHGRPVLVRC